MGKSARAFAFVLAATVTFGAASSQAGYVMKIDDDSWISLGMGMRAHVGARQTMGAGGDPVVLENSDGWEKSLFFDNGRIYINGGIMKGLTFEFNTDVTNNGAGGNATDVVMLDAIAKFEFSDAFNIWAGRLLPPSDRANLSGPYFLNTWNFPFAQRYTSIHAGRDDGAAIWGQFQGGKFKYQVGVFQGNDNSESPNFTGRLTLNLLDPEPGYYNSSTYYGTKNIFAIGIVYQVQSGGGNDAAAGTTGNFDGWNVDVLYEYNLGESVGTVTLDSAVFGYSDGIGTDAGTSDGLGFYSLAGFLLPTKIGLGPFKGQFQPTIRYQQYRNDNRATAAGTPTTKRIDFAVNWILKGHNALLTLNYGRVLDTNFASVPITADIVAAQGGVTQEIILGMQFQY